MKITPKQKIQLISAIGLWIGLYLGVALLSGYSVILSTPVFHTYFFVSTFTVGLLIWGFIQNEGSIKASYLFLLFALGIHGLVLVYLIFPTYGNLKAPVMHQTYIFLECVLFGTFLIAKWLTKIKLPGR